MPNKHQLEHRKPIFTALTTHTFIIIYLASLQIWAQTFYLPYHAALPLHEKYRNSWNLTSVEKLNVLHRCHMFLLYTYLQRDKEHTIEDTGQKMARKTVFILFTLA